MRTLLIDNYDSFTYNLAHYLAEVTGVDPVVVRNDEPGWTEAELDRFDNVVISPGPGHPQRTRDFGICAAVIRDGRLPLLGVCLGHQGICTVHGGRLGLVPEIFHGRPSPVVHRGTDILAGVPSPFSAVRYHSLAVDELPDDIEPIAWAPGGAVMALRHRHRPMWGVQFHPESIGSEHGHRILANFAELTRTWWQGAGAAGRRIVRPPASPARRQRRAPEPARLRVLTRRVRAEVPTERVFEEMYRHSAYAFWLDSSRPGPGTGRFSFMGDAAGPLARVVRADVWTGQVTVESAAGATTVAGSFFDWLEADLARNRVQAPRLPFGFALGWIGYLGYELKSECGGDRAHRSPHPDATMIFTDRALAFDHELGDVHLLALAEADDDAAATAWLDEVAARLAALARDRSAALEPVARHDLAPLRLRHDRHRYLDLIGVCQERITQGETYEVCLTNMVRAPGWFDPWSGYRVLRRDNPTPFGALLRLGGLSVLSSSPERFLSVDTDGVAESKPIKGTRPRSADPAEDERLRRDLATNAKDRAENLMIVDLVRNDLGTCAEVGSVQVPKLFDVESYATVHQLVSTVRARLRPDRSAVSCVRAAFPGGSMTGAPKIRTMEIIDELEEGPRGVYSGALGYFSLSGAADFSMVIRTLVADADADEVEFGVGGAIISLSDPAAEFTETAVKATPMLRLLGTRFPDTADEARARAGHR
jgi:para-aminobenzoate synthetase